MRWYTWKSTIELSENEVEWDIKKDTVDFLEKQALDYISLVYLPQKWPTDIKNKEE